jgi:lipopolysaccharide/colanic/teichoic acid biosynthesis glycosyltransferase
MREVLNPMARDFADAQSPGGSRLAFESAKRLFDITSGILLLFLLGPLLLFIAFLIKRGSPGPAFYKQIRMGRADRPFLIYKFRTMFADADQHGPAITSTDDPRITPVGRKLRATKLDELPQLFNVLRGEMSFVGPRPQVPKFVDAFGERYRAVVLAVRPGITGPTQLEFRNEELMLEGVMDREEYYIHRLLPVKCRMDADYVENRSARSDLRVIGQTLWLFVRGVYLRIGRRKQDIITHAVVVNTAREPIGENADTTVQR